MSGIKSDNISTPGFQGYVPPSPAPSPAPSPSPEVARPKLQSDQNLVQDRAPTDVNLGPLPWDSAPAETMEDRKEAIREMYRESMGREVCDHGLNHWANSGVPLDEIRTIVANSPEAEFYQGMKGESQLGKLDNYLTSTDPAEKLKLEQMLNLVNHPTREGHLAAAESVFERSLEFRALNPEQQQALKGFFQEATKGATGEQINTTAVGILRGLKNERFTSKDTFGQTTLDHLAKFNQDGLTRALRREDKGDLARDLLNAVVNPGSLTQGKDTLDCAEATLEATLAYSQPADYARIAVGLLTKGTASIPGSPGGRHPDSLQLATSGNMADREHLSFYMQRSFEAHVSSRDAENGWTFGGGEDLGLNSQQVKMLYDGIIGKEHATIYARRGVDVTAAVDQALKAQDSPYAVVKVTMRTDDALHAKAVIGSSEAGMTLWDPATGKTETMSRRDFNQQVVRATLTGQPASAGRPTPFSFAQDEVVDESEGGGRAGRYSRFG